jgi:hypothetical protein
MLTKRTSQLALSLLAVFVVGGHLTLVAGWVAFWAVMNWIPGGWLYGLMFFSVLLTSWFAVAMSIQSGFSKLKVFPLILVVAIVLGGPCFGLMYGDEGIGELNCWLTLFISLPPSAVSLVVLRHWGRVEKVESILLGLGVEGQKGLDDNGSGEHQ